MAYDFGGGGDPSSSGGGGRRPTLSDDIGTLIVVVFAVIFFGTLFVFGGAALIAVLVTAWQIINAGYIWVFIVLIGVIVLLYIIYDAIYPKCPHCGIRERK